MRKSLFILAASLIGALTLSAATKVACVGDSITFGYGIPDSAGKYPAILGKLLGSDFEVGNFGNSGKTAGDYPGQTGRYYGSTQESKNALEFTPDIFICNLGINDTGAWWNPDLFEQGYKNLVKDWRKSNPKARIFAWGKLGPDYRGPVDKKAFPGNIFTPDYKYSTSDNGSAKNRPAAEKLIVKIAKADKIELFDAYKTLDDKPQWYKAGLHPTAEGSRRIAEITFAKLARSLKLPQPKPTLDPEEDSLKIENKGESGILLDGWTLSAGGKKWVFEKDTVIHPGDSITVTLSDQNETDPAKGLQCPIKAKPSMFTLLPPRK